MVQLFSAFDRETIERNLQEEKFDLVIVGGGITGAGIALDATSRGMSVALVEMGDFASGTSSRSTKLVHGGLRYLQQFEIKEVADLGKERAIVYENGPHVTTPEWM
ncbi:FAD-dependent oxidoreductase, partial [Listeria monocytogenes]